MRILDPLERMLFALGPSLGELDKWQFGSDERELRAIYELNRDALVRCGHEAPLNVWPFWEYEVGLPELRDHEGLWTRYEGENGWDACLERGRDLEERRRLWLAEHPVAA